MIICRECDSSNVKLSKHIGWGPRVGNVYHYKLHCEDCGVTYFTPRTKEVYEQVKDQSWEYSKNFKRHFWQKKNKI